MLDTRGIICSMSRRGNCHDNTVAESFFSTVKSELAEHFDSHGEAKMELFDYIEVFYNQRRRHSTLGQISPAAFERQAVAQGMDAAIPADAENAPPGIWKSRTEREIPTAPTPIIVVVEEGRTTETQTT